MTSASRAPVAKRTARRMIGTSCPERGRSARRRPGEPPVGVSRILVVIRRQKACPSKEEELDAYDERTRSRPRAKSITRISETSYATRQEADWLGRMEGGRAPATRIAAGACSSRKIQLTELASAAESGTCCRRCPFR